MWKTGRTTLVNTEFMVKITSVFHSFDCGHCGKLNLSFSVLLIQKRHFLNQNQNCGFAENCPLFLAKTRCIFYEQFARHTVCSFFTKSSQRPPCFLGAAFVLCFFEGLLWPLFWQLIRSASRKMRLASAPNTRVSLSCFFLAPAKDSRAPAEGE